jgi:hypothetical protein
MDCRVKPGNDATKQFGSTCPHRIAALPLATMHRCPALASPAVQPFGGHSFTWCPRRSGISKTFSDLPADRSSPPSGVSICLLADDFLRKAV